jgi:serine/threonine protein kinase
MIFITKQGIVHGDLRCANILVFEMDPSEPKRNAVKLTNFSLARRKNQLVAEYRLPDSQVRYSAPEILQSEDGSNYSELSDVYSMGMLMYEGCSRGEVPYGRGTSDNDIRKQKLRSQDLAKPRECHNKIWNIIEDCCCNEPSLRWTFEHLKIQLNEVDIK